MKGKNTNKKGKPNSLARKDNEKPEIYSVKRYKGNNELNRRKFIGLGLAAGAISSIGLSSCKKDMRGESQCKMQFYPSHSSSVNSIAFSPDGKLIACGSRGKNILWNIPDGTVFKTIELYDEYQVLTVIFNPDGTKIVTENNQCIVLLDVETGNELNRFMDLSLEVINVDIDCDNSIPVTNCVCNTVCSCDTVCTCDSESSSSCGYWYPN
jgi:WD40 repeat protein